MATTPKTPLGGFSESIGEGQRSGDAGGYGLARAPGVGGSSGQRVQPGHVLMPLQVQSVFDTRPIDAYDFSLELVGTGIAGGTEFSFTADVPAQYTMVLRRIEFQFFPPFIGGISTATGSDLTLRILRDGLPIPNNTVTLRGSYPTYTWETHQVFGTGHTYGIGGLFEVLDPPPISGTSLELIARFMGTLILSRGRPPLHEVGSLPTFVRGK